MYWRTFESLLREGVSVFHDGKLFVAAYRRPCACILSQALLNLLLMFDNATVPAREAEGTDADIYNLVLDYNFNAELSQNPIPRPASAVSPAVQSK